MRCTKPILAIVVALAGTYASRAPRAPDAVTISPASVYLSNRDRTASFELYNGGSRPVEVSLSLAFGYPISDSLGRVAVRLIDSVPPDEPSAVDWLRLSPRRIVLPPRQRQTVQIDAQPPEALPGGEYWARLLVRSHPTPGPLDGEPGSPKRGNLPAQQSRPDNESLLLTALNYRNGIVTTGVQVDSARAGATDSTASLTLDLSRTGNAAYLGRISIEVLSTPGTVVAQTTEDVAVYRSLRRVVTLAVPRGKGSTFRYRLSTERNDVDSTLITRAEPVSGQVRFAP